MPTVNSTTLNEAARKFRRELLIMAVIGLSRTLPHLTLRTGIRYEEVVGELDGPFELRPYTGDKNSDDGMEINGRTLKTYLGSCVKEFDPNKLISSLYGAAVTQGDALKNVPINKAVLALMMKKLSKGLNSAVFGGVRKANGTKTSDLFDGFDNVAKTEITAGNITVGKNNLVVFTEAIDKTNAVDMLKAYYQGASDELQDENSKLYVPKSIYNAYCDDYKETTGSIAYNKRYKQTFLEGSEDQCEIVPLAAKKDAPYLQLTTKSNMLLGVNQTGEEEKIEVRRGDNPFKLQFITTAFFGTQYESISPERLKIAQLHTA